MASQSTASKKRLVKQLSFAICSSPSSQVTCYGSVGKSYYEAHAHTPERLHAKYAHNTTHPHYQIRCAADFLCKSIRLKPKTDSWGDATGQKIFKMLLIDSEKVDTRSLDVIKVK